MCFPELLKYIPETHALRDLVLIDPDDDKSPLLPQDVWMKHLFHFNKAYIEDPSILSVQKEYQVTLLHIVRMGWWAEVRV